MGLYSRLEVMLHSLTPNRSGYSPRSDAIFGGRVLLDFNSI
jgi:hypothetical protein